MEYDAPNIYRICRRRGLPRGFTLLEVLVASSILSFAVLALVQAVAAGQSQTFDSLKRARATALAESLLEEVLSKPYDDPQGEATFGPDPGESTRDDLDNIDDYHGYADTAGSLADSAGVIYPTTFQKYDRSVSVQAQTQTIAALGGAHTGVLVTVTVAEPGTTGRDWTVTRFVLEKQ